MVNALVGRLLVVDDDPSARFARIRILRAAGHTVFEAGRLEEARVILQEMRPEVVVLDVNLPDGDGIQFGQQIKQNEALHGVMVLQMSASSVSEDDQARGLDAGADAYLTEPAATAVLLATTRALLRLSRAERALQQSVALEQAARAEAEAANQVKDDFLATLSHELRTPLHAIVGWTALLRNHALDEEGRRRAVEVIERNAKAQAALIDDLLDISRIELGQLRLTWGIVALAPLIAAAIDSAGPTADAKGVTLTADLPIEPDFEIRGDWTRLQQVLWNLLSNAIKFTPAGGQVHVRAQTDPAQAVIEIADSGRGISPEFLPRMFERFRRAGRGTTAQDPGLGLGLAIANELVQFHGGTLTAASPGLNHGATLTLTLPRRTASPLTVESAPPSSTAPSQPS